MKFRFVILLSSLVASNAFASDMMSKADWVAHMLAGFPFRGEQLDRDEYIRAANNYVGERRHEIEILFNKRILKAKQEDDTDRYRELVVEKKRRVDSLAYMISKSTQAVLFSLDSDKDMRISLEEAAGVFESLSDRADLDSDGNLDDDEQKLAEWSMSSGIQIADKDDRRKLLLQFKIIEASGW